MFPSSSPLLSATDVSQGGFKYNWVETPPPEYVCSHCSYVARDPQQTTCCGMIYCKSCLAHNKVQCSACGRAVNSNYLPDRKVQLAIKRMKLYCTNRTLCCNWTGTVDTLKVHRDNCPFVQAPCDNGCGLIIARKDVEAHMQNFCYKRRVTCEHCKTSVKYDSLDSGSHYLHCQAYPTPCPHEGCSDVVLKYTLRHHMDICPHGPVPCIYKDIGCNVTMPPSKQDAHCHLYIQEHLMMAVNRLHELEAVSACGKSIVCKMKNFQKHKDDDSCWQSPKFYSCAGGYRMFLTVYPNGFGEGKTTHVSCSINLTTGDYDRLLKWPLEAEISLEILNQLQDKSHITHTVFFDTESPNGNGGKINKFMQYSDLTCSSSACQYVKNDTLYIRITPKIHSKPMPWLTDSSHHHAKHHLPPIANEDHLSHCGTDNHTLIVMNYP